MLYTGARAAYYHGLHEESGLRPDAKDLFGYFPRKAVYCLACGKLAEPWVRRTCWACWHARAAVAEARKAVGP